MSASSRRILASGRGVPFRSTALRQRTQLWRSSLPIRVAIHLALAPADRGQRGLRGGLPRIASADRRQACLVQLGTPPITVQSAASLRLGCPTDARRSPRGGFRLCERSSRAAALWPFAVDINSPLGGAHLGTLRPGRGSCFPGQPFRSFPVR
jgi:hypothetical protein